MTDRTSTPPVAAPASEAGAFWKGRCLDCTHPAHEMTCHEMIPNGDPSNGPEYCSCAVNIELMEQEIIRLRAALRAESVAAPVEGAWSYDTERRWLMFTDSNDATTIIAYDVPLTWASRMLSALNAALHAPPALDAARLAPISVAAARMLMVAERHPQRLVEVSYETFEDLIVAPLRAATPASGEPAVDPRAALIEANRALWDEGEVGGGDRGPFGLGEDVVEGPPAAGAEEPPR